MSIINLLRTERKSTKSSESQYAIMKLQRNLHFLQASVLVRTVTRVAVTMTFFCVMKVKAKVNQMMTVIPYQYKKAHQQEVAAEQDTGPQDVLISLSEQELLTEV